LLSDLDRVLANDGAAMLEIDPAQAEGLLRDALERFPEAHVTVDPDLSGRARFLRIDRAISG
jgi:hypothetical protein